MKTDEFAEKVATKKEKTEKSDILNNHKNVILSFDPINNKLKIRGDGDCLFNSIILATKLELPDKISANINCNDLKWIVKTTLSIDKDSEHKFLPALKSEIEEDVIKSSEYNDRLNYYNIEFQNILRDINKAYLKASTSEAKEQIRSEISDLLEGYDIYQEYMDKIIKPGAFGGEAEIIILSEHFRIDIKIIQNGFSDNTQNVKGRSANPISLYYNGIDHYDVILSEEAALKIQAFDILIFGEKVKEKVDINSGYIEIEAQETLNQNFVKESIKEIEKELRLIFNAEETEQEKEEKLDLFEKECAKLLSLLLSDDEKEKTIIDKNKIKKLIKVLENLASIYEIRSCTLSEHIKQGTESIQNYYLLVKKFGELVSYASLFYNAALSINKKCGEENLLEQNDFIERLTILEKNYIKVVTKKLDIPIAGWTENGDRIFKDQLVKIRKEAETRLIDIEIEFSKNISSVQRPEKEIDRKLALLKSEEIESDMLSTIVNYSSNSQELQETHYIQYEEEKLNHYHNRAIKIRALSLDITNQLKKYLVDLILKSEKELGIPPCQYAVLSFGSMAKETATPNSDIEFAILIDDRGFEKNQESKSYFRNLSNLLRIKVQSLRESIIPKSLYGVDLDNTIDEGFQFDLGGKTPLGRKNNDGTEYELICTISEMIEYLGDEYLKIDKLLPFELIKSVLLQENIIHNGLSLYESYKEAANNYLQHQLQGRALLSRRIEEMLYSGYKYGEKLENSQKGDLEKFDPYLSIFAAAGQLYDIKQAIYRLPDRLLEGLGLLYSCDGESTWTQIEDLKKKGWLSKDNLKYLQILISISNNLRLKASLNNASKALISTSSNKNDIRPSEVELKKILNVNQIEDLFEFYYIIVPLHKIIKNLREEIDWQLVKKPQILSLSEDKIYKSDLSMQGLVYRRLMQYEASKLCFEEGLKENPKDIPMLHNLGAINNLLGKHPEAISLYEQSLELLEQMEEKLYPDIAASYKSIGIALYKMNEYQGSLDYYDISLQIEKEHELLIEFAMTLKAKGLSLTNLGKLDGAIDLYEQSFQIISNREFNPEAARIHDSWGAVLLKLDRPGEALDHFTESLNIKERIYDKDHPAIAASYNNIGSVLHKLEKYEESFNYLSNSLNMIQRVYNVAHSCVVAPIINLGNVLNRLGKLEKALERYEQGLGMLNFLYKKSHPDVAGCKYNMGDILYKLNRYEEALECFKHSLGIRLEVYKENVLHQDVRSSFDKTISLLIEMNRYEEALEYFKQSIELHCKKQMPGVPETILKEILEKSMFGKYKFHMQQAEDNLAEEKILRVIFHYKIALKLIDKEGFRTEILEDKILINTNLGCMYHIIAANAKKEGNTILEYESYKNAETSFKQAIEDNGENSNPELFIGYANFLIKNESYSEVTEYLTKVITLNSVNSKLYYGLMEKNTISDSVGLIIDKNGKTAVNVIEYAYYLLVHNYDELIKFSPLKVKEDLLQDFRNAISSYLGYYLYATTQAKNGISNDSFLFTEVSLELLKSAELLLSEDAFNAFINFCNSKEVNEQNLSEQDQQQINVLLNLILDRATEESEKEQAPYPDIEINSEIIDKISSFIGKTNLENNVGFYSYIFNALSKNVFTASAKQVLQLINNLVDNLENLFSLLEEIDVNDSGISIWTQLEYLLEFTVSGQRFIGGISRRFGPDFDPEGSSGSGGGSSDSGDSGAGQLGNLQPVVSLPFSGIVLFNQTSIEGNIE